MVEGFRSGFYITSSQAKKEGRKQETTSQSSFFSQPQSFSSQQPGIQQTEQKLASKTAYTETLVSAEKPRKQVKSSFHQEVSEFNPSSQMSTEQLIKAVLNLQEEVRKLKKANEKLMESNEKLMENLNKQEQIDSRLMSENQTRSGTYLRVKATYPKISNRSRRNWTTDSKKQKRNCQLLRKSKAKLELQKWKLKFKKSKKRREIIKKQKEMFCCGNI